MKTVFSLVLALCLFSAPLALAQAPGAKGLMLPGDMTSELADVAIDAAIKKAQEQGTLMNIAVVDAGGNLKAFHRMDGSFLASIDLAIKKAYTARSLNMPTTTLAEASNQPGAELYGIEVTNGGMVIFGGGELIKDKDGTIIGAIGASGSSVANDVAVAKAGAEAVLKAFK
ncbi:MAG: heme-binding protein [Candidatus Adiutrix sp.]|nr:heme-binding protein [Candidatus Adiutrix sp.]